MGRRTNTVVGSSSMGSEGPVGTTAPYRIPTIVRILSELLHGFMVLFLQRGDLSYSAFCTLWKDEDMPSLHTLCPERIDYAAYIQILYYLLLETQLFLDFSATSRIPSLETIPFQEVRCLVSLVPVLYTLFTLYQTAPATSSIRSIPIRITTSKFQDLALGVRSVVELVDGVGHDVAALWAHLTAGANPGDPAISGSSPAMIPSPSAFEEAAYTGPISTFFLEQQQVLQLRRLSTVSPELPWNNISDWQRSLAALEAEKIHRWIFGGAFIDSDAPRRATEATADAAATDDATRINRWQSGKRIPAANDNDTSDSERSTGDNDDLRALVLRPGGDNSTAGGDNGDGGNGDGDGDDAIATVAGYIALRLQHMRLQIHARRQERRDDLARRQHERLTRQQERLQRSQRTLRQRVYAYEVAQRTRYAEAQREALERTRHAQQQLALQQAQLQLHQQQQQQQQQQPAMLSPSPAMLDVASYEHAPSATTAPATGKAAGKAAKTATAAGKKRTRQEASKNALDTQRITSLLDDLEAQIAAVTQQYEGYGTTAAAATATAMDDEDPYYTAGGGDEAVEDSDSEDDRGGVSGRAGAAFPSQRSQRRPVNAAATTPRRPRPAATSSAIHGANAPSAGVAEEHDTLAELEALIASVESQYTSRGRRRPTTTASTVAPVRQRRRVAAPTRRHTSTATVRDDTPPPSQRLPAVAVAAPARGRSVHHHNRDAPEVSSATASDLTNRSGAMPAPTTAATATATATATAALGGAATDNDSPATEASSSTDLAAMLAELEGLTAAVLQHTSVTV